MITGSRQMHFTKTLEQKMEVTDETCSYLGRAEVLQVAAVAPDRVNVPIWHGRHPEAAAGLRHARPGRPYIGVWNSRGWRDA